ncbi:hypothetical protein IJK16_03065 [Candidatus Saccharibacteria bacterium]|nr:hypothetical protein [Candidatus Saccharibacteria bacterium]
MKTTKIVIALGAAAALGVAVLPLASYADNNYTATTNITVSINSTFSITATESVTATATNNGPVVDMSPVVTVITNNSGGFTLKAKTTHASGPALISGSNTIGAGSPSAGTSAWGMKGGALGTTYTALKTTDTTVLTTSAPTDTSGTSTTFTIGVSASPSQAAGTYAGTITWTGTANS